MIVTVSIFLALSVTLNIFIVWYIFRLLRNLVDVTEEFENFKSKLLVFSEHLTAVSTMETYYGDSTIASLINHMKTISDDIEQYSKILVLYDEEEIENDQTQN